jgi:hypothetical protein
MVNENNDSDIATEPQPHPASEEVTSSRRRITRRSWVIAGVCLLVAVVVVVVAVLVANLLREQAETKAEAVAGYSSIRTSHLSAISNLRNSIDSAEAVTNTKSEGDVEDGSLLRELTAEIGTAKAGLAESQRKYIDPADFGSDEVDAAAAGLGLARYQAEAATKSLNEARVAVVDSASAHDARVAEEERAAKTAAAKASAGTVAFEDLSRAGNSAIGTYYRFEGRIIQDAGGGTYRVNMTKDPGYTRVFWEDTILVSVTGTPGTRLIEDDIISFTAASAGEQSYTTVLGATVTLPLVIAEASDISVTGRAD